MRSLVPVAIVALLAAALGALVCWNVTRPRAAALPDAPALVTKISEAARLETLDVTLYKKLDFTPDPPAPRPNAGLWDGVARFARYGVKAPRGRAIVFAQAHLGVNLKKLDAQALRVSGRRVEVVLPRPEIRVELLPAETEIIGSDLDSAETAQLFEQARTAFARQVEADAGLREKSAESARRTLRALFFQLGFTEVAFVDSLSPASAAN